MREKTRFAVVAVASAVAASVITSVIDRFAMKQDLEFLGIIHAEVQEGVAKLKKRIDGATDDD